jgi:hypothetical protein
MSSKITFTVGDKVAFTVPLKLSIGHSVKHKNGIVVKVNKTTLDIEDDEKVIYKEDKTKVSKI